MYLSMINLRQTICVTHKIVSKLLTTCSRSQSPLSYVFVDDKNGFFITLISV